MERKRVKGLCGVAWVIRANRRIVANKPLNTVWGTRLMEIDMVKAIVVALIGAIASVIVAWITSTKVVEESVGVIHCSKTENLYGQTVTNKRFIFTALDCGGMLPDTSYVGTVTRINVCGGMDNFEVLQPPNSGVEVNGLKPCGMPGNHLSDVGAAFFKAPK